MPKSVAHAAYTRTVNAHEIINDYFKNMNNSFDHKPAQKKIFLN